MAIESNVAKDRKPTDGFNYDLESLGKWPLHIRIIGGMTVKELLQVSNQVKNIVENYDPKNDDPIYNAHYSKQFSVVQTYLKQTAHTSSKESFFKVNEWEFLHYSKAVKSPIGDLKKISQDEKQEIKNTLNRAVNVAYQTLKSTQSTSTSSAIIL